MVNFTQTVINSISILLICVMMLLLWNRRRNAGATRMIAVAVFMLIWSVGSVAEIVATNFSDKVLWRNITQIGVFFVPAATMLFTVAYTGILKNSIRTLSSLAYGVQSLIILFIFTDRWHHLARESIEVVNNGSFLTLIVTPTSLESFLISVNYLYMIASFGALTVYAVYEPRQTRNRTLCIMIGMGISIVYSFVKISTGERFGMYVPISGAFAVSAFFMLMGIVRYNLLTLAPIARNEVFNIVDDGIIVASEQGEIVDANAAALSLFCCKSGGEESFREMERRILSAHPQWYQAMIKNAAAHFEVLRTREGIPGCYKCELYVLKNRKGVPAGSISVIRDVSEQKRQNELLRFRAETDSLTGLFNRHTFIEKVQGELTNEAKKACLLSIDIDHFKQVNDRFGHICGDHVLKETGECIWRALRRGEIAGRMGGEEFAVFFPVDDDLQPQRVAEELRSCIERCHFEFEGHCIHITVSIGVCVMCDASFDTLYRIADQNLYKAKAAHKNCVVI